MGLILIGTYWVYSEILYCLCFVEWRRKCFFIGVLDHHHAGVQCWCLRRKVCLVIQTSWSHLRKRSIKVKKYWSGTLEARFISIVFIITFLPSVNIIPREFKNCRRKCIKMSTNLSPCGQCPAIEFSMRLLALYYILSFYLTLHQVAYWSHCIGLL